MNVMVVFILVAAGIYAYQERDSESAAEEMAEAYQASGEGPVGCWAAMWVMFVRFIIFVTIVLFVMGLFLAWAMPQVEGGW